MELSDLLKLGVEIISRDFQENGCTYAIYLAYSLLAKPILFSNPLVSTYKMSRDERAFEDLD